MIRDPSDGSVRSEVGIPTSTGVTPAMPVLKPGIDSGLPLESQKAERQARLEKSRAWLKDYFKCNPEQGA